MIDEFICEHINCVVTNNIYWYIAQESNLLIGIDLNTMEICDMSCIPYPKNERAQYRSLFYAEGKLYMLPFFSNIMYIYDHNKKNYREVTISDKDVLATGCIYRDDYMYIYSDENPRIIKYNLRDEQVGSIDVPIDIDLPYVDKKYYFWTDAYLHKGIIYIPFIFYNAFLRIDKNDSVSILTMGNDIERWESVHFSFKENYIYALMSKNEVSQCCVFDLDGNIKNAFQLDGKFDNYMIFSNSKWILLPYFDCKLSVVDIDREIITESVNLPAVLSNEDAFYTYGVENKSDLNWVSLSKHDLKMLFVNLMGDIKVKKITLNDENRRMLKESCTEIIKKRSLITENKLMTIESLIAAVI